jgi:hypothetical protein
MIFPSNNIAVYENPIYETLYTLLSKQKERKRIPRHTVLDDSNKKDCYFLNDNDDKNV